MYDRQSVLCSVTKLDQKVWYIVEQTDSQLSASDHVAEQPHEAVTASSQKYARLSVNLPHTLQHVSCCCLPTIGACCAVSVAVSSSRLFGLVTGYCFGIGCLAMQLVHASYSKIKCTHLGFLGSWFHVMLKYVNPIFGEIVRTLELARIFMCTSTQVGAPH